jgi:hypothetical protein
MLYTFVNDETVTLESIGLNLPLKTVYADIMGEIVD